MAVAPHRCTPARLQSQCHVAAQAPGSTASVWDRNRHAAMSAHLCLHVQDLAPAQCVALTHRLAQGCPHAP